MKFIRDIFKPKQEPLTLIMEIKMSAEVLGPSVNRAVSAYKKLQESHAAAVATILEQDGKIKHDAEVIAGYKAILDEAFPDNGGSMGGVTE